MVIDISKIVTKLNVKAKLKGIVDVYFMLENYSYYLNQGYTKNIFTATSNRIRV